MTLPSRPTPTRIKGDYTFIYVECDFDDGTPVMVGQITEATGGQEEAIDEWRTVGSGILRESSDTKYPVSLTILVPEDPAEAAHLIGIEDPAPWVGTEQLKIDPTVKIQYTFEDYDSAENLLATEYWDDVTWDKLDRTTSATGQKTWKLTGEAADVYTMVPASA